MTLPPEGIAAPSEHPNSSAGAGRDASSASPTRLQGSGRRIVVCHHGHENDVGYTENLFEFFSAHNIDHGFLDLRLPDPKDELRSYLAAGSDVAFLGFNSQLDHSWLGSEPLVLAAARHGVTVVQWICDHPSASWPEFNYPDPAATRFAFHSRYSQAYFERYCCPPAVTAVGGSLGPNRRSRATTHSIEAYSERPFACLIALGLARIGKSAEQREAEMAALDTPLRQALRDAIAQARFELYRPLEGHLAASLEDRGLTLDDTAFSRCFRLLNDSVQHFRRAFIIQVASRFGVTIQSDATAAPLINGGAATFRQDVGSMETLDSMPRYRAILSVSPVNDSVHDRTCNALNAASLPILEDNRAHRARFFHGRNALLFRYHDDSLTECLELACGSPGHVYPIAERAAAMCEESPFRFGSFSNLVALANLPPELLPAVALRRSDRTDGGDAR